MATVAVDDGRVQSLLMGVPRVPRQRHRFHLTSPTTRPAGAFAASLSEPSLVPRPLFSTEGRGRGKSGLVFIAWAIVRMRISITQVLSNRILQ